MNNENYWFMDLKDKIETKKILEDGVGRFCPPHYLPHKLPIGEKVMSEPCHFHENKLRTSHHNFFCKWLKCYNYKDMLKAKREFKK